MKITILTIMSFLVLISNNIKANEKFVYPDKVEVINGQKETIEVAIDNKKENKIIVNKMNSEVFDYKSDCFDNYCFIDIIGKKQGKDNLEINFIENNKVNKVEIKIIINELTSTINKNMSQDDLYFRDIIKLNKFYNIQSVDDADSLNEKKRVDYFNELEKLKEKHYPEKPSKSARQYGDGKSASAGDILATYDSKSYGYQHGHSAIHSWYSYGTTEAVGRHKDRKKDIVYLKNSIKNQGNKKGYWLKRNKRTVRFEVKNSSRKQNVAAAKWAANKETKKNKKTYYCLIKMPSDGECYNCTTLVTSAWKSQGITIKFPYQSSGGSNAPQPVRYPKQFFQSKMLKTVKVYHK